MYPSIYSKTETIEVCGTLLQVRFESRRSPLQESKKRFKHLTESNLNTGKP